VGGARVGRNRQQVAHVRFHQCPGDLPCERHREGPGDGPLRDGRTAPPFRQGEQQYGQDSDPELFEDQSECPPRVRVRPLEVGAEKGECGRGEQPRRSPPPRPSQGDEGRCGQSPGNSHVCGDSRLRYVRLNAQCTDGEPCCHDEGSNDHGSRISLASAASRLRGRPTSLERRSEVAADSFDFGMKPRAPHETTRRP
jgi:hypothetical protein